MPQNQKKPGLLNQSIKIIVILVLAIGLSIIFIMTKPEAKKRNRKLLPSIVGVMEIKPASENIWVDAMGVVKPLQELKVISEVGGRVEWINDKLIPGGFINEGDIIAKIEKTDYEIAIEQAKANLSTAKKNLLVEEGAARSAKVMEDMSKISTTSQAKELRMRVPHIDAAEANLNAAVKLLEQAEKDLARTDIVAPFPILIESDSIEIGNYVTRLSTIAEAVGTSAYWVEVTLPVSKIYYLEIPGVNSKTGSEARIIYKAANGKETEKEGRVVRLLGSLDNLGRMAKVLIEVKDPLGIEADDMDKMLLLNSYVQVQIKGIEVDNMVELPREYLRDDDTVWTVDQDDRLVVKDVEVAWRNKDKVFIKNGITVGDRVVVSNNFVPVDGMKLVVRDGGRSGGEVNEE